MTVQNYQEQVDGWINKFGVRYFSELTNLGILMEEVGELSRLMVREYGEQSFKEDKSSVDIKAKISDEISDIIFVLTCLSNQMNIDITQALEKNIKKKTDRDHSRHKLNDKL